MSKVTACLYANVNDSVDEKGQNLSLLHKRQSCSWIGPQAIPLLGWGLAFHNTRAGGDGGNIHIVKLGGATHLEYNRNGVPWSWHQPL